MEKRCNKCLLIKSETEFYKYKGNTDGYNSRCKECLREYWKQYYARMSQDRTWRAKQSQRQTTRR